MIPLAPRARTRGASACPLGQAGLSPRASACPLGQVLAPRASRARIMRTRASTEYTGENAESTFSTDHTKELSYFGEGVVGVARSVCEKVRRGDARHRTWTSQGGAGGGDFSGLRKPGRRPARREGGRRPVRNWLALRARIIRRSVSAGARVRVAR